MKAAQLVAPGQFEIRDIPAPAPGPGEVLVRVRAAGLCSADVQLVDASPAMFPLPLTLGHESTGVIQSLGSGVEGFELGQAVLVAGIWGCGSCRCCLAGRDNACEYWARRAPLPPGPGLGFSGGMAELMVAPARAIHLLDDVEPVDAAPLADAGVAACHAINLTREHLRADATVAVIGAGGSGSLALQILRATTACRIIAVDADAVALEESTALGADLSVVNNAEAMARVLELTDGLGVEAVFDFRGASASLSLATETVAAYGAVVAMGLGAGTFQVVSDSPPLGKPRCGVSIVRPYGATRRDIFEVIALAARGKLKARIVRHCLTAAPAVLASLALGELRGCAVLVL